MLFRQSRDYFIKSFDFKKFVTLFGNEGHSLFFHTHTLRHKII